MTLMAHIRLVQVTDETETVVAEFRGSAHAPICWQSPNELSDLHDGANVLAAFEYLPARPEDVAR